MLDFESGRRHGYGEQTNQGDVVGHRSEPHDTFEGLLRERLVLTDHGVQRGLIERS